MIWICDHDNILVVLLLLSKSNLGPSQALMMDFYTAWKVSVFGVILVRIFQHTEYLSVFSPNAGKYGPE